MTYPVPPGPRIAYDLDGSMGFAFTHRGTFGVVQCHPSWLSALNADSGQSARVYAVDQPQGVFNTSGDGFAIRLATPMRLRAIAFGNVFALSSSGGAFGYYLLGNIETSADSTNGIDGTWRTLHSYSTSAELDFTFGPTGQLGDSSGFFDPPFRENQIAFIGQVRQDGFTYKSTNSYWSFYTSREFRQKSSSLSRGWREVAGTASRQVLWVRFSLTARDSSNIPNPVGIGAAPLPLDTGALFKLHLYGEPDTMASEHRLAVLDGGIPLDWGDVSSGDVKERTIRVQNLSTTMSAGSPVVRVVKPDPVISESPESWISLSLDGALFGSSLMLPDLPPGEVSDPITLRLTVGSSLFGPVAPRLSVQAEEWA